MNQLGLFRAYLEVESKQCATVVEQLRDDERIDEANLEKVRQNIFDIVCTLTKAAMVKPNSIEFLLEKMDTVPNNWRTSLALAKENNDTEKVIIEELKLTTIDDIQKEFLKFGEVIN